MSPRCYRPNIYVRLINFRAKDMTCSTPKAWLPLPAAKTAALRLFCLGHAGGGASHFASWARAMPPEVDVQPIQLPGHQERLAEPCYRDMGRLAGDLGDAIRTSLDAPYALFGHSMGGIISFELARWCRSRGLPQPLLLAVAACPAPRTQPARPLLCEMTDADLIRTMRQRFGEMPAQLLRNAEFMAIMLPILRADLALVETYAYGEQPPLDCPILTLGGTGDAAVPPPALAPWQSETTGPFSLRMLPGGHFFVNDNPQPVLQIMARRLTEVLKT